MISIKCTYHILDNSDEDNSEYVLDLIGSKNGIIIVPFHLNRIV